MDLALVAILIAVIFVSGLLQSLSGFGFCLLALPVLTFFAPTKTMVPALVILSVFLNLAVVWKAREHFQIRAIWPLLVTGACFTPLGAWLLSVLDEDVLKLIVGGTTCLGGVLLLTGLRLKPKSEKPRLFPIGAVSGALGGSVSLNGPPVVLYFTAVGKDKQTFRASIAGYFFVLNALTVPSHAIAGLITAEVLKLFAIGMLPLAGGIALGIWLSAKVSEKLFRKLVIGVVIAMGLVAIGAVLF